MPELQQHQQDLSGVCHPEAKWTECLLQLHQAACPIETLRIYHNSAAQLHATASALQHNSSVSHLELGAVQGHEAFLALTQLLQVGWCQASTVNPAASAVAVAHDRRLPAMVHTS